MHDDRQYLLPPEGEEEAEIKCCIIFYPDHPAYRRALWGSLDYLGSWIAWERDEEHRGTVAAKLWKSANEQTWECFDMGCFEDLVSVINKISINLQFNQNCYCDTTQINPPPVVIPPISNEDGDPPETYGGGDVEDWLDWRRKVCGNADKYVDLIIEQNLHLVQLLNLSAIGFGVIGAILGVLTGGGFAVIVAAGTVAGIFGGLIQLSTFEAFSEFAADIEDARDDIKCAIVCSQDLSSIIEAAIDPEAWTLFYQFVNWSNAAAAIRYGEIDDNFFDPLLSDDSCDFCCEVGTQFHYTWDVDLQGFPPAGAENFVWETPGNVHMVCHTNAGGGSWNNHAVRTGAQIISTFGLVGPIIINTVRFDLLFSTGTGGFADNRFRIRLRDSDIVTYNSPEYNAADFPQNVWNHVEWVLPSNITLYTSQACLYFDLFRSSEVDTDHQHMKLDNFRALLIT